MIYKGVVFKRGNEYFIHTQDKSLSQKVYPLVKNILYDLLLELEVFFELTIVQEELDEQITYEARFLSKT